MRHCIRTGYGGGVDETCNSVEDWVALARRARDFCVGALAAGLSPGMIWSNAGFPCEYLLKAAIMRKERLNAWPDPKQRRELYTHDLEALLRILGAQISPEEDVAPAWAVVMIWRRAHMYRPEETPVTLVRDFLEAAFGEGGFEEWMLQNYLKDI